MDLSNVRENVVADAAYNAVKAILVGRKVLRFDLTNPYKAPASYTVANVIADGLNGVFLTLSDEGGNCSIHFPVGQVNVIFGPNPEVTFYRDEEPFRCYEVVS